MTPAASSTLTHSATLPREQFETEATLSLVDLKGIPPYVSVHSCIDDVTYTASFSSSTFHLEKESDEVASAVAICTMYVDRHGENRMHIRSVKITGDDTWHHNELPWINPAK